MHEAVVRVLLTAQAHGVYQEIVAAPPQRVKIVTRTSRGSAKASGARNAIGRALAAVRLPHVRTLSAARENVDLIHSCQQLLLTRTPWVVDLEHGQPFVGTRFSRLRDPVTRSVILAILASRACRAILPWTRTALEAFVSTFNPSEALRRKLHVVYPAIRPVPLSERPGHGCRLLFVANRPEHNVLLKGGRELLEAFRLLQRDQVNLSLVIIGPVPAGLLTECQRTPGVVLMGEVSKDVLFAQYRQSHVYVMPTVSDTFGMVFLEAMAHGLPVVALDRPYTAEIVRHGETGLLVPVPRETWQWCAADGTFVCDSEAFINRVIESEIDATVVRSLAETIGTLVDNAAVRVRLGDMAREEITIGRFSTTRRNAALRSIYEEGLASSMSLKAR